MERTKNKTRKSTQAHFASSADGPGNTATKFSGNCSLYQVVFFPSAGQIGRNQHNNANSRRCSWGGQAASSARDK